MNRLIGLAIVVAAIVGGLAYFGVFSPAQMEQAGREAFYEAKKAAGAAADLLPDARAKDPAAASACRENLKRIETAKRAVAQRQGLAAGTVSVADICRELGRDTLPACPSGGVCTVGGIGQLPVCSIGANGTSDTNDDHLIRDF